MKQRTKCAIITPLNVQEVTLTCIQEGKVLSEHGVSPQELHECKYCVCCNENDKTMYVQTLQDSDLLRKMGINEATHDVCTLTRVIVY